MTDEENLFEDVLEDDSDEDESSEESNDQEFVEDDEDESDESSKKEERSQQNKDAEEARKRRQAKKEAEEELAKKEAERIEAENKAKEEKEAEEKKAEEKKEENNGNESENKKRLGKELTDFKKKYPDISLEELDSDKNFKKYLTGKLLGKQTFIEVYEDFIEMKTELSGKTKEEINELYLAKKKQVAPSPVQSSVNRNPIKIYSEAEFDRLTEKIPLMSSSDWNKIKDKYNRSLEHYIKKK